MSTSPKSLPLGRRVVLQFVFTIVIVSVMLGAITLGSFVTHFVWRGFSDAPVRTAAEALRGSSFRHSPLALPSLCWSTATLDSSIGFWECVADDAAKHQKEWKN